MSFASEVDSGASSAVSLSIIKDLPTVLRRMYQPSVKGHFSRKAVNSTIQNDTLTKFLED